MDDSADVINRFTRSFGGIYGGRGQSKHAKQRHPVHKSHQLNQLTRVAGLTRKGYGESLPPTCSQNPCRQLSRCTGIPGSGARGAPVQRTRARIRLAGDLLPPAIGAGEWNVFLTVFVAAVVRSMTTGKTEADVDIRCIPLSGVPFQPTWVPPFDGLEQNQP